MHDLPVFVLFHKQLEDRHAQSGVNDVRAQGRDRTTQRTSALTRGISDPNVLMRQARLYHRDELELVHDCCANVDVNQ